MDYVTLFNLKSVVGLLVSGIKVVVQLNFDISDCKLAFSATVS